MNLGSTLSTPEFFKVLGVRLMGRTFSPNDPRREGPEIIIGRGLWQRRFGSDVKLLGKVLDLNIINLKRVGPTPSFVVGIALTDAHFPPLSADFNLAVPGIGDAVDFWVPEVIDPSRRDTGDLDAIEDNSPTVDTRRLPEPVSSLRDYLVVSVVSGYR